MSNNYHPIGDCKTCHLTKRIMALGMCGTCYNHQREKQNPELRAARLAYMRKWQYRRRKTLEPHYTRRQSVGIIAKAFGREGITPEDLCAYLFEARRRNPTCHPASRQSFQQRRNRGASIARTCV